MGILNSETTLLEKTQLTDTVYKFVYSVPKDFTFIPGQFVNLMVKEPFRRSYSILQTYNGRIDLIIDVKPGGIGSQYFIKTQEGDVTKILGPLGPFRYQDTNNEKIFIATGTGIVPFIPMIKEIRSKNKNIKIKVFFGIRYLKHDIASEYFKEYENDSNFDFIRCVTRPENNSEKYSLGRVTEVIDKSDLDFQNAEFYICGVNTMIFDMQDILKSKGSKHIYFEKYG